MNLDAFHGCWVAVQVRLRREYVTAFFLSVKGYELFVPSYTAIPRNLVQLPLFPGYIFCKLDTTISQPIMLTPGVLRIVGFGNVLVPVDENEIESLKIMCRSGFPAGRCAFLEVGARVVITQGALRGVQGTLVAFKNKTRLIVSVGMLQRSVFVECDSAGVTSAASLAANEAKFPEYGLHSHNAFQK